MKADAFRFDGRTPCDLSRLPTDAGGEKGKKDEYAAKTAANLRRMEALQEALYADGREGLVILLQALDAAGKDGTIKHVMGGLNPQGVTVYNFKQPHQGRAAARLSVAGGAVPAAPAGASPSSTAAITRMCWWCGMHGLQKTYRMADRVLEDDDETFFSANATVRSATLRNICTKTASGWSRSFCTYPKPSRKSGFWSASTRRKRTGSSRRRTLPSAPALTSTTTCTARSSPKRPANTPPGTPCPPTQKWYTRYLVSEVVADALEQCAPAYPRVDAAARAEMQKARRQLLAED